MTLKTRHDETPTETVAPWRAMLLAHNRAVKAIEADMASAGVIPLNLYDVLLELNGKREGLRMQELGEQVVLSRTRVSRLVDELEASGYVERVAHPDDGRAKLAQITARGHTALTEAAPIYLEGINRHFSSHLSAAEQVSITQGLTKVVDFHDKPSMPAVR